MQILPDFVWNVQTQQKKWLKGLKSPEAMFMFQRVLFSSFQVAANSSQKQGMVKLTIDEEITRLPFHVDRNLLWFEIREYSNKAIIVGPCLNVL